MNLFDTVTSTFTAQLAGGAHQNNLIGATAELIGSSDIGGFDGLIYLFAKRGQGDTISSWVSGMDKPISGDVLADVLGPELIQQVADSAGVSEEDASYGLARMLPQLVYSLANANGVNDALSQLITRFRGR